MKSVSVPLQLAGVHLQPYNEIIRPGRVWKISKYFLRRWTPYLPASYAWLLIGARQESYFNGNRPWFKAYDANLAAAAGIHVRSFRRSAKKDIVAGKGPLAIFIHKAGDPAYVQGEATPKQEETRYEVRLDDPLTPADAAHLAYWLRRHGPRHVTAHTIGALLAEARAQPASTLRAPESEQDPATPLSLPASVLTVADVVAHVFPGVDGADGWGEAADRLHSHIVDPQLFHLESQYLRRHWLPELGPGPLLLLVYLRSLCYHNPQTGEIRDQVALRSGTLERIFQKSSVTLRAWFNRLDEMLGTSHPHGPFLEVVSTQKLPSQLVETTYRLNLLTPLHPGDLTQYQALVATQAETAASVTQDLSVTTRRGDETFVSHAAGAHERNVSHGEGGAANSDSHGTRGPQSSGSHEPEGEQTFGSGWHKKWQPYKYYKDLLAALEPQSKTAFLEKTAQQQHAWKVEQGVARQPFAAAVFPSLDELLDAFAIHGSTRQRIRRAGLTPAEVVAWYLYAEREAGLEQPARYMMKQAAAGAPPPDAFYQLARQSWEQWRTYAAACYLQPWLTPDWIRELGASSAFMRWHALYGQLDPEQLPFGVGEGLAALVVALRAADSFGTAAVPAADVVSAAPGAPSAADESCACWQATLQELEQQMTRATFNAWLRATRCLRREGNMFIIQVRNQAAQAWLANRMEGMITRTLSAVAGEPAAVSFVVADG